MTARPIGSLAAQIVNGLAERSGRPRPFADVIPIADRESWLAMRKQDVTASGAAALLGVHPFVTAYGLWAEKTGAIAQDGEMTEAMERGIELEPLAVRRLAKVRPTWLVEQPNAYYRDPKARLGATPDAFASDPERPGFGVVQIKSVEPRKFRKDWRNEDGEIEPPLWIVVQAIIEAHLTGAQWAAVAALVISYGIELHVVEVPLHAGIIERIRAETEAFWRMVEDGHTPDPDYKRDGTLLSRIYAEASGPEIDLSADNEIPSLLAERERISAVTSENRRRSDEIKAALLHKIGPAQSARVAGGIITAKTVNRKGYTVEPSSYRDIRFKPAGAAR